MLAQPSFSRRRFSVDEYHRMGQAGGLTEDDRVELIEGELIERSPTGSRHAGTVARLHRLLERAAGDEAQVWSQNPITLGDGSEPQPDLALLCPRPDFYTGSLPRAGDVLLAIEIADTSLPYDREIKLPLYARHGIPEAWLVDLQNDRLEIHYGRAVDFRVKGFEDATGCAEVRKRLLPLPEEWDIRMEDISGEWIHIDTNPVINHRFFKP